MEGLIWADFERCTNRETGWCKHAEAFDQECPEGVSNITSLLSDIFNMNLPTIKVYDLYTEEVALEIF